MIIALTLYLIGMVAFCGWLAFTACKGNLTEIPTFFSAIREGWSMDRTVRLIITVVLLGWPGFWVGMVVVSHDPSYLQDMENLASGILDIDIDLDLDNE